MRLLKMVLNRGAIDGGQLLSPAAVELMTTNQAGECYVSPIPATVPQISDVVDFFPEIRKTHTAAFMRTESDVPGKRRAGSLSWAGVLNTHYWVDPTSDIRAILMTQMLPFCAPEVMELLGEFETAVYREFVTA
jgi:CubicO group peptidase (beta-lactamase class C family)